MIKDPNISSKIAPNMPSVQRKVGREVLDCRSLTKDVKLLILLTPATINMIKKSAIDNDFAIIWQV